MKKGGKKKGGKIEGTDVNGVVKNGIILIEGVILCFHSNNMYMYFVMQDVGG